MRPRAKPTVPDQTPLVTTDGELLMRFVRHRDGAAIDELVRKYAPLVMAVCRQTLGSRPDAEDAFQATFLILAKRAASIERESSVAGWLYRVAYRTAMRLAARRRRIKTKPLLTEPTSEPEVFSIIQQRELQQSLHEELARLPLRYREPILLRYFAEKSGEQIADELECSEAAIKGRLARGRKLLRLALTRRGVSLSVALGACLATQPPSPALAHTLIDKTIAACTVLVQPGGAPIPCSPEVIQLANLGARAMLLSTITKFVAGPLAIAVALTQLPDEEASISVDANHEPAEVSVAVEAAPATGAGLPAATETPPIVIAGPGVTELPAVPGTPAAGLPPTAPRANAAPIATNVSIGPTAPTSQALGETPSEYDAPMLQALRTYYRDKAVAYNQRIEAMAQEAQAYAADESDRVRLLDRARHLQALAAQAEYKAERDLLAAKAQQVGRQLATMQQIDESSAFTPAAASRQSTDVLQPGDRVMIHAVGVSENDPIAREYVIEPNGSVALGPTYGRVQISGLSAEEAERAIVVQLEQMFKSPKVQITHADGAVRQSELESLREDVRALRALLEGLRREPQSVGPTSPSLRPGR